MPASLPFGWQEVLVGGIVVSDDGVLGGLVEELGGRVEPPGDAGLLSVVISSSAGVDFVVVLDFVIRLSPLTDRGEALNQRASSDFGCGSIHAQR